MCQLEVRNVGWKVSKLLTGYDTTQSQEPARPMILTPEFWLLTPAFYRAEIPRLEWLPPEHSNLRLTLDRGRSVARFRGNRRRR